jgi:hypothetical protein
MDAVLDPTQPQKTSYCVPIWLRDEQIKANIARIPGRIARFEGERDAPIAIVCYGPSLADTWEELRDFRYIMTCSGAHKFLVDHGITPTHHIDVDPREHKATLLGTPQPGTEYLIASTCHAKVFDLLEGFNVKLWHIFDSTDEGLRILPPGEWALTGGCGAGLRAMIVAHFLGFKDQHVFGMDGNVRPSEDTTVAATGFQTHGGAHPNQPPLFAECTVNGRTFRTTPGYLEAARNTGYELDQMPGIRATFHGDGLVQELMKTHKHEPAKMPVIAHQRPVLISEEYRELNARLHRDVVTYGVSGRKRADAVLKLSQALKTTSILDYGCGKGHLAQCLPFPIWEYDPAIPGKEDSPRPADIVVCTDVLEHIERDKINAVLDDLARCVVQVGYFVIHTGPAVKKYANGQNTHLIQKDESWWTKKIGARFHIGKCLRDGVELVYVVGPKNGKRKSTTHAVFSQPAAVG